MNIKLFSLGSMIGLTAIPLLSLAGCNDSYQNMIVQSMIQNHTNYPIICYNTNLNGAWVPDTPSSWPITIAAGKTTIIEACKSSGNVNNNDAVYGTISCYIQYPDHELTLLNQPAQKNGAEVGAFNFNHTCTSSLNTSGDGSCFNSDYDNSGTKSIPNTTTNPGATTTDCGDNNCTSSDYYIKSLNQTFITSTWYQVGTNGLNAHALSTQTIFEPFN